MGIWVVMVEVSGSAATGRAFWSGMVAEGFGLRRSAGGQLFPQTTCGSAGGRIEAGRCTASRQAVESAPLNEAPTAIAIAGLVVATERSRSRPSRWRHGFDGQDDVALAARCVGGSQLRLPNRASGGMLHEAQKELQRPGSRSCGTAEAYVGGGRQRDISIERRGSRYISSDLGGAIGVASRSTTARHHA